ncbi:MAG: transposase [Candidatus Desulfaltia sp.]|nr:transposase [Candidatus Desulfaltia sp.]
MQRKGTQAYKKRKGRKPTKKVPTTKPEKASTLAEDESIPWKTVCLGDGSKGPVYAQIKCVRIYRAFKMEAEEVESEACWLFIRRREDGDTRFSVSNAPEDIDESELCKASIMRWPIEQCFKEMKDQLGMDHVEARSWKAWHRHMLLVFIAYEFLLDVRLLVLDKKKTYFITENGLDARHCISATR